MNEREAKIVSMRDEGKSWREIGAELGISPPRASQLYARAKEKEQLAEAAGYLGDDEPLFKLGVNTRIRNALSPWGITTVGQAEKLVKSGLFGKIRNIGPKFVAELREKLKAHGHLTDEA